MRVRDNGIGIAADQLPRLFDMFAQVDTSLERSRGGLGIGLTLVKTLAEMHGGSVEARSEGLGRGSEFVVRLPALETMRRRRAPQERSPTTAVAGRRVLIVDDNQDGAESLAMLLDLCGHETHQAHDGLERSRPPNDSARRGAARHRPAGLERLRGVPPDPPGALGRRVGARGTDRMGPGGRPPSIERGRLHAHVVKPVDHGLLMRLLASLPSHGIGARPPAAAPAPAPPSPAI